MIINLIYNSDLIDLLLMIKHSVKVYIYADYFCRSTMLAKQLTKLVKNTTRFDIDNISMKLVNGPDIRFITKAYASKKNLNLIADIIIYLS